jgi:hypothetical protein
MKAGYLRIFTLALAISVPLIPRTASALTPTDQVKINEVRIDATESVPGEQIGEYVELYNAGGATAYLDGAILSEEAGAGVTEGVFKFPGVVGGTTIPLAPGAYMLIVPTATGHTYAGLANFEARQSSDTDHVGVPDLIRMNGNGRMALANAGDDLHLYTGSAPDTFNIPCNTVVDGVAWGTGGDVGPIATTVCTDPAFASVGLSNDGKTIGRCPSGNDTNVSSAASFYVMDPTPKAANQLVCVNPAPVVDDETRTPCAPLVSQAATVTATITNATSASIRYSVNGGPELSANMINTVGTTWSGTIPGQLGNGTRVAYYVRAINATPDTTVGFNQGYFVGTVSIGSLRQNDVNGQNLYRFYGVNVAGVTTVGYGEFSTTNTDYYIQDATGGINIFKFGTHTVQPPRGRDVRVTGTLLTFNGKLEISTGGGCDTVLVEIDGPAAVPAPLDVNTCTLGEATEGRLIRLRYPTTNTPAGTVLGSNATYKVTSCHPDTVDLFIDGDTDVDGTTLQSQQMEITGISGQFDNSSPFDSRYQIVPRSAADIVYLTPSGTGEIAVNTKPRLFQSTPNPFSKLTTIEYEIPAASAPTAGVPVRISLFDISGRKVTTLVDENVAPGVHAVTIDADGFGGLRSGIFFYVLEVEGVRVATQKLVLNR